MTKQTEPPGAAEAFLEASELVDGPSEPASFGELLSIFRTCDDMTQAEFAEVLGVLASYVSSVENGDRSVTPETAAAWAAAIGYPETVFVERALQDQLDGAGLEMRVRVEGCVRTEVCDGH